MSQSTLTTIAPDAHDRTKLLGGSDIAAVIGCSPWRTPYQLWLDKSRPRVDGPVKPRDPKARGVRWESVVAEMLVEQLEDDGHTVEVLAANRRYRDADLPFLASEIDFEIVLDGEDEITNVELKTVHPFKLREWGDSGSDDLPTHYTAQVMHGLGVTRRRKGMLAALFGADELRTYPVAADDAVIAYLRRRAQDFWQNHVLAGVAPSPTNLNDLDRLYPRELEGGAPLLADEELTQALLRLRAIGKEIGAREAEAAALEFQIKRAMKDAVAVVLPTGKTAVEWKLREGKALDHDALKAAIGTKVYRDCHKPWQARTFTLKPFAIDGL
jgi:putative phage-type endonuclease